MRVGRRGLLRRVLRGRRGRVVLHYSRRAVGDFEGRPPRRVVGRGRGAGRRGRGVREAVAVDTPPDSPPYVMRITVDLGIAL